MTKWREYQEEAAALFRALGLEAANDERLEGARGMHAVDVVVRSRRAGLQQLWLVECKWRRRRVEKLHVAALAEIVHDVGADRGVLLSEVGFQAGAVSMAYKSNITLTSLAELRLEAADEILMLRLGEGRMRLGRLRERLAAVTQARRYERDNGDYTVSFRASPGRWDYLQLHAAAAIAEEGIRRAELGRWPAPYAWDFMSNNPLHAEGVEAFTGGLTASLDRLEHELTAFESVNADCV